MEGIIVNFRGSRKVKRHYQMVVQAANVTSIDKAKELIGKSVIRKSPAGKELKGKVTKEHGNSGALRVQFETGMPGQSLSQKVLIE